MGTRKQRAQTGDLWIASTEIVVTPGHAFYDRLNGLLAEHGFDVKAEKLCRRYYTGTLGRPSIAPGVYFRALLLGYFEGIDSERGIAWRLADSLSMRKFIGYALTEQTPDHSTISRTRRLYTAETHKAIFRWVLKLLVGAGLAKGQSVSIDATTLEANAALRSIVRRDTGESYDEYLKGLAKAAGIENPTRQEMARLDRKRRKKGSNKEWKHPHDPDARIARMKNGSTHLAHKVEHAVDLSSGALLAVTLQGADQGDTTTIGVTLAEAQKVAVKIHERGVEEVVADKGYHSGEVLKDLHSRRCRSYIPEPKRPRRQWDGKETEKKRVYANRRRVAGARSKRLQKLRSELTERSMAHMYETGAMRRVHLKGRVNILKRLLVQAGAFNLALMMRKLTGVGKPRRLQGLPSLILAGLNVLWLWISRMTRLQAPTRDLKCPTEFFRQIDAQT